MRLIDADACWDRILNGCCTTEAAVINTPTIDPVHAAGACYCKECFHSEQVEYKFADDWVVPIEEYWCNKHKDTMPINGFCSEGRKDDMKNETI